MKRPVRRVVLAEERQTRLWVIQPAHMGDGYFAITRPSGWRAAWCLAVLVKAYLRTSVARKFGW